MHYPLRFPITFFRFLSCSKGTALEPREHHAADGNVPALPSNSMAQS
jgi:hypothetical protein